MIHESKLLNKYLIYPIFFTLCIINLIIHTIYHKRTACSPRKFQFHITNIEFSYLFSFYSKRWVRFWGRFMILVLLLHNGRPFTLIFWHEVNIALYFIEIYDILCKCTCVELITFLYNMYSWNYCHIDVY